MKIIIYVICTMIVTYTFGLIFAWWGFVIPLIALGYIFNLKIRPTFAYAMLGVFLLWLILMLLKDSANEGILSAQISELFEGIPVIGIAIIFSLIASLLGGFGALLGKSLRHSFASDSLPDLNKSIQ